MRDAKKNDRAKSWGPEARFCPPICLTRPLFSSRFISVSLDELSEGETTGSLFKVWFASRVPFPCNLYKGLSLYLGRQDGNIPALYHYPRLCIIQHHDHQHAAFYPPIPEMQRLGTRVQARLDQITSQQIIKFVQDYLKDSAALIVKTEFF